MSGTEAKAPDIETKETLVSDDERIVLPETPELPPQLDTALETFVEGLSLENSEAAEFVLGSALAATAESFGPSEAENLLSNFDQELTAQFFEQLIETGDIPQSPTMNNLLAGDVNSPAAQFILENLAAQSASGAFITMQANLRNSDRATTNNQKKSAIASIQLMESLNIAMESFWASEAVRAINAQGWQKFNGAEDHEQRTDAYEKWKQDLKDEFLRENPDATPEMIEAAFNRIDNFVQSDIVSQLAQQVANGEITQDEMNEKIRAFGDDLNQNPELKQWILEFDELNDNIAEKENAIRQLEQAAQHGDQNSHVVTHYQAQLEDLKAEQAAKLQQIQDYRNGLENGDISELSLQLLDNRIAQEQAELDRLNAINLQIDELEESVETMGAKAEDFQAEKADAEFELTMAQFDRTSQAMALGTAHSNHESVVSALHEAGHATIRLKQVGGEFLPERDRGLLATEFKLEGSAEDAVTYVVQADENGELYVDLGKEGKLEVSSWMEGYVSGIDGAHIELEGAQAEAYSTSLHEVNVETAALSDAEIAVQAAMTKISSINALAIQRQGEVSELSTEKDSIQSQITAAAEQGLPTEALQARLDVLDEQIGNFNQAFSLSNSVYDFTTSQYDFSLFDTTTDYSTNLGASSMSLTDFTTDFTFDTDLSLSTTPEMDLGASSFTDTDLFGTTQDDPFYLDYNFDFGLDFTYDFTNTNFLLDDNFMTEMDKLESYLTDMDTQQVSTDLNSIQADLETELTALKMEMIADAGVPAELQEAFMKDLDVSILGGVCVNLTHVKEQLGIEPFSLDNMDMNSLFNASAGQSENEILAQKLANAADQFGVGEKGDRYRAIVEQLEELTGQERQVAYAGDDVETEAENLTFEAPTVEEMSRDAKLANEARNYADQVRSNGVVTERDLEDAFPGLSSEEMDLVKAEMIQEGIEVKPVEELTQDDNKPEPTNRELTFAEAAQPTEFKPMTLGA